MDATGFDPDIFIEAVKTRPVIWNILLPEYHDKIKKRSAWTEVCSLMYDGFENKPEKVQNDLGSKLMKKWKGMRDTFLKSTKKKTISGQGATNRSYIYARQMEFLLNCGSGLATTTSVDQDTEETTVDADLTDEQQMIFQNQLPGPSTRPDAPLPETSATAEQHMPTKRKPNVTDFAKIPAAKRRLIVEENLLNFMNSPTAATPAQEETDDDRSFFNSLLPIVRALPVDTKLEFRCNVMTMLREMRARFPSVQQPTGGFQQNISVPPQTGPSRNPANVHQPLSVTVLNQQQQNIRYTQPMLQQGLSYTNLSPANLDSNMGQPQPYPWVQSPSNSNSQHSSYTSPNDRNTIE